MANLRPLSSDQSEWDALNLVSQQDPDQGQAGPPPTGIMGNPSVPEPRVALPGQPTLPTVGGANQGQGPRERQDSGATPSTSQAPSPSGGRGGFEGGGSSTMTPPSVTQPTPPTIFNPLPAPQPESLVFPQGSGGPGLLGRSGGLQGGGIGLPGGAPESEDPSSLILSLLSMLGQG